jgi:hypothetical protein
MATQLDEEWAVRILDGVKALISEIERLEAYCNQLEAKVEVSRKAAKTLNDSFYQIKIREEDFPENYCEKVPRLVDEALADPDVKAWLSEGV